MVRSIFVVLFFATVVGCTENDGDIISDVGQNEEVNVPKTKVRRGDEKVHARCSDCDHIVSLYATVCPNCGDELLDAKFRNLCLDAGIVRDSDYGEIKTLTFRGDCSDSDMQQLVRLDRRFRKRGWTGESFFEHVQAVFFDRYLSDKSMQSMLRILDTGRSYIPGAPELDNIDMHLLFSHPVSDVVTREIALRTYITSLDIRDNEFTDDLLGQITIMVGLRGLNIHFTRITDDGLSQLERLKKLKHLTLPQGVTNDGLSHLDGLTSLKTLILPKRNFSQIALDSLQDALPDCAISIRDFDRRSIYEIDYGIEK